jgi:hypothetical protein
MPLSLTVIVAVAAWAVLREFSSIEMMIERETTLNVEQSASIGNIDTKVSVVENRISALVRRLELGISSGRRRSASAPGPEGDR